MKFRASLLSLSKTVALIGLIGWFSPSASGAAASPPAHPENALVDGPALVKEWFAPVYPPDALKEKIGGRTVVRIIVDETGKITAARVLRAADPRLGEAALAAVKTWTFSPAMEKEKAIASCLDVPLNFSAEKGDKSWPRSLMSDLNNQPQPAAVSPATKKFTPKAEYPETLTERKLPGVVRFSCGVDATGHLIAPRIFAASHADFVLPALAALARWEFNPAKQGDLAVATELVGEVSFEEMIAGRAVALAANNITALDGTPPEATPQPLVAADTVWPHALLMKGTAGEALVEFTVDTQGNTTGLKLRSASQPEFGSAALAALETWKFRPAVQGGRTVAVSLLKKVEFVLPATENSAPARLLKAVQAGEVQDARGLDQPLTPLFRTPPVYPAALLANGRPKGAAEIEFVIARDGRARFPRIVSATQEEFGWAAATAIAQWLFQAPRRGGEAVDVKVRIPFNFAPP